MTLRAGPSGERHLTESVAAVRSALSGTPAVAVVLGSGLGEFGDRIRKEWEAPTSDIPYYPASTVPGHKGRLVFGWIEQVPVLIFQGRVHFYESGSVTSAVYPVRVAERLGIRKLVVTNAAGGVSTRFDAGDLMAIADQINLTSISLPRSLEKAQVRQSYYDPELLNTLRGAAGSMGIAIRPGVYAGVRGPSYETASEVEMVRRFGGDAVGMSTVLEVELAFEFGMKIAGISLITNRATTIGGTKLSHQEVLGIPPSVKENFSSLLAEFLGRLGGAE